MSNEHTSIELTTPLLAGNLSQAEDAKSQNDNKQEDKVAIPINPQADELSYFYITRRGITLRIPVNQVQQSIHDLTVILLKLTSWSELTKTKIKAPLYAFIIFFLLKELDRPNMPTVLEDLGDTVDTISSSISILLGIFALLNGITRFNLAHASQAKEALSEKDAEILSKYIHPSWVRANTLKDVLPDFLLGLKRRQALTALLNSVERSLASSQNLPPTPTNRQSVQALTAGGGGQSLFSASSLPTSTSTQSTSIESTVPKTERKEEQKASNPSAPG